MFGDFPKPFETRTIMFGFIFVIYTRRLQHRQEEGWMDQSHARISAKTGLLSEMYK